MQTNWARAEKNGRAIRTLEIWDSTAKRTMERWPDGAMNRGFIWSQEQGRHQGRSRNLEVPEHDCHRVRHVHLRVDRRVLSVDGRHDSRDWAPQIECRYAGLSRGAHDELLKPLPLLCRQLPPSGVSPTFQSFPPRLLQLCER